MEAATDVTDVPCNPGQYAGPAGRWLWTSGEDLRKLHAAMLSDNREGSRVLRDRIRRELAEHHATVTPPQGQLSL